MATGAGQERVECLELLTWSVPGRPAGDGAVEACTEHLVRAADGVGEFVELGGKVLGPMVKRTAPDAKVTSVVTIEDVEALAKEIA